MMQANLIPLRRQELRVRRSRLRRWVSFCTFYCVLLVAGYGLAQGVWSTTDPVLDRDVIQVSDDISFAKDEIAKVQPRLTDAQLTLAASRAVGDQPNWSTLLALLASELRDSPAIRFPNLSLAETILQAWPRVGLPHLSDVLKQVIDDQLHNVVLSACELDPIRELPAAGAAPGSKPASKPGERTRFQLTVHGLGRTPGSVSQFVLRLEQTNLFERVTLLESKRTTTGENDVVNFRIQCVLGK